MRFAHWFVSVALCLNVVGCGDSNKKKGDRAATQKQQVNGNDLNLIDAGTLAFAGKDVRGTGTFVFQSPMKHDDNSVSFSLSLEDQGSLLLTTNADRELKSGVSLKFARDKAVLKTHLMVGDSQVDISGQFAAIDASQVMKLHIDIHNSEDPAHVVVWVGDSKFSEHDAVFNSEEHAATPGKGSGKFWGLQLVNAQVLSPSSAEPKLSEH